MKLKELTEKLNKMHTQYGDIDVCFDFKTGGNCLYSFEKDKKINNI